jgi:hypothetical protein
MMMPMMAKNCSTLMAKMPFFHNDGQDALSHNDGQNALSHNRMVKMPFPTMMAGQDALSHNDGQDALFPQ